MSRHEAVSCDSCLKGNFRGRRYKCLICFDYDLCATCYEQGATTTRHTTEHPMQCILTRSDFDLYYGGESLTVEQPQAFTCPYCSKMGFTETALQEHVTADHADTSFEVVCPVCAAMPGGEANLVTNDFAGHLTLEHRSGPRDLISFLDEPTGSRHGMRRIQHPIRGVGGPRARRSNMHFSSALSPSSSRDTVDPIAELLSQLSGVRRTAASQGSTPSQLQQLQMQLHLERQQVRAARQQLERLPRRPTQNASGGTNSSSGAAGGSSGAGIASTAHNSALPAEAATPTPPVHSQLMLSRCMEPNPSESELERMEQDRADRSLFVQELVLTMMCDEESPSKKGGDERVGKVHSAQALWGGGLLPGGAATKVPSRCMLPRPQQPPTTAPIRPPPAPRGTGTIREPVYPQPMPVSPGTARRKPIRPVVHSTSEPPPSH